MAATFSKVGKTTVFGDRRITVVDITGDASYPTGGYAVSIPNDLSFPASARVDFFSAELSAQGYQAKYDHTNNKIVLYYGDYNNAADGPLIEVPNATNVSTVVLRGLAVSSGV